MADRVLRDSEQTNPAALDTLVATDPLKAGLWNFYLSVSSTGAAVLNIICALENGVVVVNRRFHVAANGHEYIPLQIRKLEGEVLKVSVGPSGITGVVRTSLIANRVGG